MYQSRPEIIKFIDAWINVWEDHDFDGVMDLLHDDVVFENWTGEIVRGKNNLRKLWFPWFRFHGNFKFSKEDVFVDVQEQKVLFKWRLEWPSIEPEYRGRNEIRRGVDILQISDGKILKKYTYSKTTVLINRIPVKFCAQKSNVDEYQNMI